MIANPTAPRILFPADLDAAEQLRRAADVVAVEMRDDQKVKPLDPAYGELVEKRLVTDLVELYIGYDRASLRDKALAREYGVNTLCREFPARRFTTKKNSGSKLLFFL